MERTSARSLQSVLLAEVFLEGFQRYASRFGNDEHVEAQGNNVDKAKHGVGPRCSQVRNHDREYPGDDRVHQPTAADGETLRHASDLGRKDLRNQNPIDGSGLLGEDEERHQNHDEPGQVCRDRLRDRSISLNVGRDSEAKDNRQRKKRKCDASFLVDTDMATSKTRHQIEAKTGS